MKQICLGMLCLLSLACAVKPAPRTPVPNPITTPPTVVTPPPSMPEPVGLSLTDQRRLTEWHSYATWSQFAAEAAQMGDKQRMVSFLDAEAALKIDASLEHRLRFLILASFQTRLRDWGFVENHLQQLQDDPCFPNELQPWLTVLAARLRQNHGVQDERRQLQRNIRDLRQIQESLRQKIEALSQIETDMGRPPREETKEQTP